MMVTVWGDVVQLGARHFVHFFRHFRDTLDTFLNTFLETKKSQCHCFAMNLPLFFYVSKVTESIKIPGLAGELIWPMPPGQS